MARIRHIAIQSNHPGKAADFFKRAFGLQEIRRVGLDPANPDVAPRPSATVLTDGELNITIIKPEEDQVGVGLDFVGIHHIGIQVDDMTEQATLLEELGAPLVTGLDQIPPGAHLEIKFRGPDNVVFDISDRPWPGTGGAGT